MVITSFLKIFLQVLKSRDFLPPLVDIMAFRGCFRIHGLWHFSLPQSKLAFLVKKERTLSANNFVITLHTCDKKHLVYARSKVKVLCFSAMWLFIATNGRIA